MAHRPETRTTSTRIILLLMAAASLAPPCTATTFFVNSSSDAGDANPGDGVCATAGGACGLRAAVEEANGLPGDDTVTIGAGTYYVGDPIEIFSNLTINGGGNWATEISGGGIDRIFEITPSVTAASYVIIRNVHLTAGWVVGSGGLLTINSIANVTLDGCVLDLGLANSAGGCISNLGSLTLTSTVVENCTTLTSGGGIVVIDGQVTLQAGSILRNNEALDGGGIFVIDGTVILENSEIYGNEADDSVGHGGGLAIEGGGGTMVRLTATTVDSNSAWRGGGIYIDFGELQVEGSTISENSATGDGGGVYHEYTLAGYDPQFTNVTISGNTAGESGGGFFVSSTPCYADIYLNSCTITGNTADLDGDNVGNGGGITKSSSSAAIRFTNTIIAGNHDNSIGGILDVNPDCTGNLSSEGYNLIGVDSPLCFIGDDLIGNLTGDSTTPLNPMLGSPTSCWGGEVHELQVGSPAVNAGNPAGCTWPNGSDLWDDQCLETRHFDGRCDMGAVELQETSASLIFADGFESGTTSVWSESVP